MANDDKTAMEEYIEGFPSISSIEAGYDAVSNKSCKLTAI